MNDVFDLVVIGAGVVGAAIAREAAQYRLKTALVESASDVGSGTSKANTAILHTGFDATPGLLEASLLSLGHQLLRTYAEETGIPVEYLGAILAAWDLDQVAALKEIRRKAHDNGVTDVERLTAEEIYAREPRLGPGILGGISVPGESIICPFTTNIALATQAVINGVSLFLNFDVENIRIEGDIKVLVSGSERITAKHVVNAAGLSSDRIDRLFGYDRFTVVPRRGELLVYDKLSRDLISSVILPVPTAKTKGVLVSPTVFGNILVGPTAEDMPEDPSTATSEAGLSYLVAKGHRILPPLENEEITATYAGLRAATEHKDYQIFADEKQGYVCVGGIRSTGLSACLGIAKYVFKLLADIGLGLSEVEEFQSIRMPNLGESKPRPHLCADMIRKNPEYGKILCHCERVSRGEALDAMRSPIPARSLDGLRRRTRCLQGRCQGFYCLASVVDMLAEETGISYAQLLNEEDLK